ncbi:hypothetical protein H5410_002109 [Solanum commersonii]|uniref:Uncharacterized protein n=1 Tax=Solanum commersonii TaxID=4109 RepID=A0A9J6B114_SOLCO|nr:hypothetical protein H5410_002109 [Solanum commersonii]
MELLPDSEVHHLIREGSDHVPLHVTCNATQESVSRPFMFLNFWTKHSNFKNKKFKEVLAKWSKVTFGNIVQQIATLEDVIKVKEAQFEINPSAGNMEELSKAEADLKKFLHLEEEYWKQKAGMRWFRDGGRKRKLNIAKIKNSHGDLITSTKSIREEAVTVFKDQFMETNFTNNYDMLEAIPKGSFPFIYLGCPVFYGRKNKAHFEDLVKRRQSLVELEMKSRIGSQRSLEEAKDPVTRMVADAELIASYLQTTLVLPCKIKTMSPLVCNQFHSIFAKFYWGNTTGAKSKNWISWDKMCLPKEEQGLSFRLYRICQKLWWISRVSISLWSAYMWNKYCKKLHPILVQGRGASHKWRKMIMVREEVEHQIWWQEEEIEVKEFINQGNWDIPKLISKLSEDMVQHIMETIKPPIEGRNDDRPWWMANTEGVFSVKSAWELVKKKKMSLDSVMN